MSDDDLIRRGDAMAAVTQTAIRWGVTGEPAILVSTKAAISALPAVVPVVKALVWHEGDEPDEWKSGPYDVWCELGKFQLYYWSIVMGEPHETADAAKASAYAHHRARILSALAPQPAPEPRDVRAALDNKEQLDIWAQEILEGLGFADVLKIESYEDKIEAHSVIGRGIVEVLRALIPEAKP